MAGKDNAPSPASPLQWACPTGFSRRGRTLKRPDGVRGGSVPSRERLG